LLRKKGGLLNSLLISNEIYAQNYGDDFSDYVEFASENYGDGSLADTNSLRRNVLFCCLGYLQLVLHPRLVCSPTQP
jgi:hypothetical protein